MGKDRALIHVTVPYFVKDEIVKIAKKRCQNNSVILRDIIVEWLEKEKQKKKQKEALRVDTPSELK